MYATDYYVYMLSKIAIVHDTLTEFGGAERLLQSLLRLYPDAHVYTAYIDEIFVKKMFPALTSDRLHVSVIQRLRLSRWGYLFQFIMPQIWKGFDLERYDVVISSSSFLLSNTIRVIRPVHIQYILGPPKNIFGLSPQVPTQKVFPYERFLARQYEQALKGPACLITISEHMQQMLKQMFGVSSGIIYPPVGVPNKPMEHNKGLYYLTVTRLDDTKDVEILIHACSQLSVPLKIVGKGSDEQYMRYLCSIAGPTIDFLGFLEDSEIQHLYSNAIAFLFSPHAEDFGIAPVEAMAHGVPIISYYGGGAKETVVAGKTGAFFYNHTPESLIDAILKFSPDTYSSTVLFNESKKFSEKRFHREIRKLVDALMEKSGKK